VIPIAETAEEFDVGPVLALRPSSEEKLLRETVAAVAASFGHEYFMARVRADQPATELWTTLGEKGFLGACLPAEYGGGGRSLWTLVIVAEELAAAGCPLIPLVFSQAICGQVIAKHGRSEQKDAWLGGIASGELKFSFALTEPDAGSNSHKLSTVAERVGDSWSLRGTKTYISGVEDADQIMVVARTGTSENGRGRLSLFIVDPDAEGLERQHIPTAIQAPEKQWMLFFDGVTVGPDRLVGTEHEGMRIVFDGLNPERILGATIAIGIGRYALDKAARYACEREVWGVPIGAHQGVSHPLAAAKIELELARLMIQKACALYDAGDPGAGEAANMAKYAAAEAGVHCIDQAVQVHGGNGVALEYGLTDMWWLARLLQIVPVSREMVLNFVAEHSLGLPKSY
jgi:alkylation response protein AidB-like acyl-CoA dehydrogenase